MEGLSTPDGVGLRGMVSTKQRAPSAGDRHGTMHTILQRRLRGYMRALDSSWKNNAGGQLYGMPALPGHTNQQPTLRTILLMILLASLRSSGFLLFSSLASF